MASPLRIAFLTFGQGERRREMVMHGGGGRDPLKVQYVAVGRDRREWMWKAKLRDEAGKTIAISGLRFGSLLEAVRDARTQIGGLDVGDDWDDGPAVA